MKAERWPCLSVTAALLPDIRRELLAHARAARALPGPPIDLCAICEDGLFGYELAPHAPKTPFLIIGCASDGVPRLRRTSFDPSRDPGLHLATVDGAAVGTARARSRRAPRNAEVLYADWGTAASHAWAALDPALDRPGNQWDLSMQACRSLEHALALAAFHLREWDPIVDFCGLVHQAEYGLPLRGADQGTGTLTLRAADFWHLHWRCGSTVIDVEFSHLMEPHVIPALLPRDAAR